jgi:hypothetical protein
MATAKQKAIAAQTKRLKLQADAAKKEATIFTSAAPIKSPTVDNPTSFGQRESETSLFTNRNPPFIYPGGSRVTATNGTPEKWGAEEKVNRGYIRRLTEFYKNVEGAKTLQNLRCNFQFNPELITRSIEANHNMQYFFNQNPNQLAQPIPGQASFGFVLLFNREAEMASGKYKSENGDLVSGKTLENGIGQNPEKYITENYDPAWVTEIGVLADILILDDIVGQGLAKDIIQGKENNVFKPATETGSSTKDATDTTDNDLASDYDANKLSVFSANIGNKAYLVPTPVRIMLSEWFMVEGFIMSHKVTFNKFNTKMVPTQAIVELQVQALYIGFAQKETFLTQSLSNTAPDENNPTGSGGAPSGSATPSDVVKQTTDGTKNFMKLAGHLQGKKNEVNLIDAVFANPNNKYEFNFAALVSDEGQFFYNNVSAKEKNGGGLQFSFSGEIRIWWTRHVSNATNSRITTRTSAVTSGSIQYADGPPPKQGQYNFADWGTKTNPFILTCPEMPVYYNIGKVKFLPDFKQHMVFGQDRADSFSSFDPLNTFGKAYGQPAFYTFTRPSETMPIPFEEDQFTAELTITIKATRFGDTKPIEQTIRGYYPNIRANANLLWGSVTPSPAYRKGGKAEFRPADRIAP